MSNILEVWELWASVSACGGSGEGLGLPGKSSSTARHVQLNILPFLAPRGRRGWKKFYAVLKGTVLYLQKVTMGASPLCCLQSSRAVTYPSRGEYVLTHVWTSTELLQRPELEDALLFDSGVRAKGTIHSLKGNPEGRSMKKETQISAEVSQQVGAVGEDE